MHIEIKNAIHCDGAHYDKAGLKQIACDLPLQRSSTTSGGRPSVVGGKLANGLEPLVVLKTCFDARQAGFREASPWKPGLKRMPIYREWFQKD